MKAGTPPASLGAQEFLGIFSGAAGVITPA